MFSLIELPSKFRWRCLCLCRSNIRVIYLFPVCDVIAEVNLVTKLGQHLLRKQNCLLQRRQHNPGLISFAHFILAVLEEFFLTSLELSAEFGVVNLFVKISDLLVCSDARLSGGYVLCKLLIQLSYFTLFAKKVVSSRTVPLSQRQ